MIKLNDWIDTITNSLVIGLLGSIQSLEIQWTAQWLGSNGQTSSAFATSSAMKRSATSAELPKDSTQNSPSNSGMIDSDMGDEQDFFDLPPESGSDEDIPAPMLSQPEQKQLLDVTAGGPSDDESIKVKKVNKKPAKKKEVAKSTESRKVLKKPSINSQTISSKMLGWELFAVARRPKRVHVMNYELNGPESPKTQGCQ